VQRVERERAACDGVVHDAGPDLELAAAHRADEVRAVGVKTLIHEQVDLAEINQAEVDRNLLAP
jgi:hypothetical protein